LIFFASDPVLIFTQCQHSGGRNVYTGTIGKRPGLAADDRTENTVNYRRSLDFDSYLTGVDQAPGEDLSQG